jgi:hypothetical protein
MALMFVEDRPFARTEAAAKRLLEIASTTEPDAHGHIYVEVVNVAFLRDGGAPDDYRAGMAQLTAAGLVDMHPIGACFRFTDKGVQRFA